MRLISIIWLFAWLFAAGNCSAQESRSSAEITLRNKGFSADWITTLRRQGEPRWYSGKELNYIGQPVGGQYAGQVYLGGDGRLWYWDIFNQAVIDPGNHGDKFYNNPMIPDEYRSVGCGFVLDLGDRVVPLDARGFSKVRFRGEYPIGRVQMSDERVPVAVELEAFSPFCPTDSRVSSLPATMMCYALTNTSDEPVTLQVGGWLENASNRSSVRAGAFTPTTEKVPGATALLLTASPIQREPGARPDDVVHTDSPQLVNADALSADTGSMALALLGSQNVAVSHEALPAHWHASLKSVAEKLPENVGVLETETTTLAPGATVEFRFAICWHFPHASLGSLLPGEITRRGQQLNHYAKFYADAGEVAKDLCVRHDSLVAHTRLWRDTWYDSTLPVWFLDRTFQNVSTLATTAAVRMHDADERSLDGRVYFWEGVYLGAGTCTHVTHYEQAFGRLFPDAARVQRLVTDFGAGWNDQLGYVQYRAEWNVGQHYGIPHAIDGHAGTILRTYREHATSVDDSFLRSVWPRVKRATQFMIDQDAGRGFYADIVPKHARNQEPDGVLEGPQYHTLDKYWNGVIPWTSGMYLASLRASAQMAEEMGDTNFADKCSHIADIGGVNLTTRTFSEDYGYFIQHPDHESEALVNVNIGCHIDQVLGDYWTRQTGLTRVFPEDRARKALASIFKHNLYRRAEDYRDDAMIKVHRFYADDQEPGTFICTFPHGGARKAVPKKGNTWDGLVAGYLSECMTGFTYAAAAQMIDAGLVTEGLALCRAIHQRYAEAPLRRNPFNEVEYGNHYTRAMSSYGAFVSACGFSYHGPKGQIGFAPRVTPREFKAAFTAASGWGSYSQHIVEDQLTATVELKYGELRIRSLMLELPKRAETRAVKVIANASEVQDVTYKQSGQIVEINLPTKMVFGAGTEIETRLSYH